MNPRIIIAPFVLTALLVGGYFIDRSRAQAESVLSGYFESQPTQVSSRQTGRVQQILEKEGDRLRSGQPLIRMEAKSSESNYGSQLEAANQAQQQYLETARGSRWEDVAKQAAAVREAEADLAKLKNGPLPEEIRASRDKYAESKAQYEKALAGSRPEEIASARATANEALEKYRQSQRGLTQEERAQLKARLDSAAASEALATKQLERSKILYDEDALAREQVDKDQASLLEASAARREAQQALKRAQEGTPTEELAQARAAYEQARAQLDLVLRGNRPEDIEAAKREMQANDENLKLLLRGSRAEDIHAGEARLQQAKTALTELQMGNRKEDVAKAKAAARQADLQAKSVKENLQERNVNAPIEGIVDRVLVADGDLVNQGTPIIQISDPNDIWMRVYLPEQELPKVKVGDSAQLAFDGIPGFVEGIVESIATQGQFTPANLQSPDERAKQVFAIRIRLARPDSRVKAGMYATVKKVGLWP